MNATMTTPRKINVRWLNQQHAKLDCTAKVVDGQPNPNYTKLAAEITEAAAEMERRTRFEQWVKANLGAILNQYPLRAAGQTFEPGQVFFDKDKATGKITLWTISEAWTRYEQSQS